MIILQIQLLVARDPPYKPLVEEVLLTQFYQAGISIVPTILQPEALMDIDTTARNVHVKWMAPILTITDRAQQDQAALRG